MKQNKNIDLQQVKRLAELGLDNKDITYALGIKYSDFHKLLSTKEFSDALANGRTVLTHKVEKELHKVAFGYSYYETRYYKSGSRLAKKKIVKYAKPDRESLFRLRHRLESKYYDNWKTKMV